MIKLFNKSGKHHLNPYNQLDNYKGKFSKEQMNDILNQAREYLVKIQEVVLDEMRKDRSVTGEELKEFARNNPLTWAPQKVKQAMNKLNELRPHIANLSKTK